MNKNKGVFQNVKNHRSIKSLFKKTFICLLAFIVLATLALFVFLDYVILIKVMKEHKELFFIAIFLISVWFICKSKSLIEFIKNSFFVMAVFIIALVALDIYGILDVSDLIGSKISEDSEPIRIDDLHKFGMVVISLGVAIIAWIKLSGVRNSINSDFLLRIIEHYTSEEIVKARKVIHELYLESKVKFKYNEAGVSDMAEDSRREKRNEIEKQRRKFIAKKICEIRNSQKQNDPESFSRLLSLLDFLESISYLANQKKISEKDIKGMIGNSLGFYYDIYKAYIDHKRDKYDKGNYYCDFEKLKNKLR